MSGDPDGPDLTYLFTTFDRLFPGFYGLHTSRQVDTRRALLFPAGGSSPRPIRHVDGPTR
ncbi:hypothetical protein FMEAI12_3240033 [Parafrankia sp. Ea1.12]|nr:hypothetical protein FMEAI12_3240033 [Parafrankia sp. Ea1.12]